MPVYNVWSEDLGIEASDPMAVEHDNPERAAEAFVRNLDDGDIRETYTVRVHVCEGIETHTFAVTCERVTTYDARRVMK